MQDAVDEKRGRRHAEAGKAAGFLVHGGIGDPDPALDDTAGVLLQEATNGRCIDADLPERFTQGIIRNRILLAYGAFRKRLAEIVAFVENDDVRALAAFQEQVFGSGQGATSGLFLLQRDSGELQGNAGRSREASQVRRKKCGEIVEIGSAHKKRAYASST